MQMSQSTILMRLREIEVIDVGTQTSVFWKAMNTMVSALRRYQPNDGLTLELDENGFTIYVGNEYSVSVFTHNREYHLIRKSPGVSERRNLAAQSDAEIVFDRVVGTLLDIAA